MLPLYIQWHINWSQRRTYINPLWLKVPKWLRTKSTVAQKRILPWRLHAITLTNLDLSSVVSCAIHLTALALIGNVFLFCRFRDSTCPMLWMSEHKRCWNTTLLFQSILITTHISCPNFRRSYNDNALSPVPQAVIVSSNTGSLLIGR